MTIDGVHQKSPQVQQVITSLSTSSTDHFKLHYSKFEGEMGAKCLQKNTKQSICRIHCNFCRSVTRMVLGPHCEHRLRNTLRRLIVISIPDLTSITHTAVRFIYHYLCA